MNARVQLWVVFTLVLGGCGFWQSNTVLPGLGNVPLKSVCADAKSCDARGDAYANVLKSRGSLALANGQGPEQYLGRVAPDRKTRSALATCSAAVNASDVIAGAPVLRSLTMTSEHRQNLRVSLKAQLARLLASQGNMPRRGSLEETVEAVAGALDVKSVSLSSQTFWLSDTAFERRVSDCGEDKHGDIIYSMTVLELSELFRKDAESKLVRALELTFAGQVPEMIDTGDASGEAALAEASVPQTLDEIGTALLTEPVNPGVQGTWSKQLVERRLAYARLAQEAVAGLAGDTRIVAAFGFDEP